MIKRGLTLGATRSLETTRQAWGMSDKGRLIFKTVCSYRCDDTCIAGSINPYPLGGRVTAPPPGVRLAINRWERVGKAVNPEPDGATPSSKWLRLTKVKIWLKRRQVHPANAGYFQAGPNGKGSRPWTQGTHGIHSKGTRRKVPAYGHEQMGTRNGVTYLWLSELSPKTSRAQLSRRQPYATDRQDGSRSKCLG
jgi:hypothetical protein